MVKLSHLMLYGRSCISLVISNTIFTNYPDNFTIIIHATAQGNQRLTKVIFQLNGAFLKNLLPQSFSYRQNSLKNKRQQNL